MALMNNFDNAIRARVAELRKRLNIEKRYGSVAMTWAHSDIDILFETIDLLLREHQSMEKAMTFVSEGASIDRFLSAVVFVMSPDDFKRLLDFGVQVSGQYVTVAAPIKEATDE